MLILFAILIFVYNFGAAFLSMSGSELSMAGEFIYAAAFPCGAIWWIRSDPRRSGLTPYYCHGLLMGAGWLVIIPYHLLKTRGTNGFLPLLLLIASFVVARIAAGIAYVVLFGFPAGY
jgi:hypothetical protein